jgi:hypothetical protein
MAAALVATVVTGADYVAQAIRLRRTPAAKPARPGETETEAGTEATERAAK